MDGKRQLLSANSRAFAFPGRLHLEVSKVEPTRVLRELIEATLRSRPAAYPAALLRAAAVLLLPLAAQAHSGDLLDERGTAVVDGVIAPGEYAQGCAAPISQTAGVVNYTYRTCHVNDDVNDYYAFKINDLTPETNDTLILFFDNDHDGVAAAAGTGLCPSGPREDAIGVTRLTAGDLFLDGFWCQGTYQTGLIPREDSVFDVNGALQHTPGEGYVFEFSHPLSTGDPNDYDLVIGDTVGLCVFYYDESNDASSFFGFIPSASFPLNCPFNMTQGLTSFFANVRKVSFLEALLRDIIRLGDALVRIPELDRIPRVCLTCPPFVALEQLVRVRAGGRDSRQPAAVRGALAHMRRFLRRVERYSDEIDEVAEPGTADALTNQGQAIVEGLQSLLDDRYPDL